LSLGRAGEEGKQRRFGHRGIVAEKRMADDFVHLVLGPLVEDLERGLGQEDLQEALPNESSLAGGLHLLADRVVRPRRRPAQPLLNLQGFGLSLDLVG